MSTWNHRGLDIWLNSSRLGSWKYVVEIAGERISKGSLDEAKKVIDKHFDAEAAAQKGKTEE